MALYVQLINNFFFLFDLVWFLLVSLIREFFLPHSVYQRFSTVETHRLQGFRGHIHRRSQLNYNIYIHLKYYLWTENNNSKLKANNKLCILFAGTKSDTSLSVNIFDFIVLSTFCGIPIVMSSQSTVSC